MGDENQTGVTGTSQVGGPKACPIKLGAVDIVVKRPDGQPAEGVPVVLGTDEKKTGSSGAAQYAKLPLGAYRADARIKEPPLWRMVTKVPVDLEVKEGPAQKLEWVAEPLGDVGVKVTREDTKKPVPGIVVKGLRQGGDKSKPKSQPSTDQGVALLQSIAADDYDLVADLTEDQALRWDAPEPQAFKVEGGKTQVASLALKPAPLRAWFHLLFQDPDGKDRPLPKDFPVVVLLGDGTKLECKVGEKGELLGPDQKPAIVLDRAKKSAELTFKTEDQWVVCEKFDPAQVAPPPATPAQDGAPPPKPPELTAELVKEADPFKAGTDLRKKLDAGARAFLLPKGEWSFKNTTWKVTPAENFADGKFKLDDSVISYGKPSAPLKLVLDPHWQHVKLVHKDRWHAFAGRSSIPRMLLQGFVEAKPAKDKAAEIAALWDTVPPAGLGADAARNVVQAVPWIIQEKDKKKPDAKCILQFKFADDDKKRWIKTADDGSRTLDELKKEDDKPGPERLRWYDLPALWRSRKWYTSQLGGAGKRWEKALERKTLVTDPIIFCLDDLVLADKDGKPLPDSEWVPAKRCALFSHLFDNKDLAGTAVAGLSEAGLYKADVSAKTSFFTKKPADTDVEKDRNYIADYPDWTRLVVANGNLFDVFDARVAEADDADETRPVGARAAIRWMDTKETAKPLWDVDTNAAAADKKPKPNRLFSTNAWVTESRPDTEVFPSKDKPYFAMQPFYACEYANTQVQYADPPSLNWIGRNDMVLLRCCGRKDGEERAVNLHYWRYAFKFLNASHPADKADFIDQIQKTVNARWNGTDGVAPGKRGVVRWEDGGKKIAATVVWFSQHMAAPDEDRAHFLLTIRHPAPGTAPRDDRGHWGIGNTSTPNYKETDLGNATNPYPWFVSAHEAGHADGLPDDYGERWNGTTYDQLGYRCNQPGDPFEVDDTTQADAPMMRANRVIRARYYWHAADWVRRATGKKTTVQLGTWTDFQLPPHETPGRTYAHWPLVAKVDHEVPAPAGLPADAKKVCDLYLYAIGKDKFATEVLAAKEPAPQSAKTYDGILVVLVRLETTAEAGFDEDQRKDLFAALVKAAKRLNHRFYLTGTARKGTDQEKKFDRCLLHFSPRFFVTNPHDATAVAAIQANFTRQYGLVTKAGTPRSGLWSTPAKPPPPTPSDWNTLKTAAGLVDATLDADVTAFAAAKDAAAKLKVLKDMASHATLAESGTDLPDAGAWSSRKTSEATACDQVDQALATYNGLDKARDPDKLKARVDALVDLVAKCGAAAGYAAELSGFDRWVSDTAGTKRDYPQMAALDDAMRNYHAAPVLSKTRIVTAKAVADAAQAFVDSVPFWAPVFKPSLSKAVSPAKALKQAALVRRKDLLMLVAVSQLKTQAEARLALLRRVHAVATLEKLAKEHSDFLTASVKSRDLEIVVGATWAEAEVSFATALPWMFGVFKSPADVTPDDLKPLLAPLNLDGAELKKWNA